jgi:hypothetical protein
MWMSVFPKEQFLILKAEDFFADTRTIFRQVLEFLDLPDWELEMFRKYYAGGYITKISAATRKDLVEYFAPHNQRLYEYLGIELGWDK